VGGMIRHGGVLNNTRVPNVTKAHSFDLYKGFIGNIVQLTNAVLFNRTIGFIKRFGIAE
jgi:hypothetical protein